MRIFLAMNNTVLQSLTSKSVSISNRINRVDTAFLKKRIPRDILRTFYYSEPDIGHRHVALASQVIRYVFSHSHSLEEYGDVAMRFIKPSGNSLLCNLMSWRHS